MKQWAALLAIFGLLLATSVGVLAQEAASTAEPAAATAEVPESVSDIFARLPQTRTVDGGFVVGAEDAPITVVEFADYACPHCQVYRPVIDQVIEQYVAGGQARFELRILPTAGGPLTYYVGQLVECANHQRVGTFWQAYELLYGYATSGQYDQDVGQRLSDQYDLNYDKLSHCAESAQQVERDIALANAVGVMGTPAVMVRYGDGDPQVITLDGRAYNQGGVPFDVLAQVIAAASAPALTA